MPQPNILFIIADEQRYDCSSACGNPQIKTPQTERLAADPCGEGWLMRIRPVRLEAELENLLPSAPLT
jgi:hypothetical protein